jgi:hypothetical protein
MEGRPAPKGNRSASQGLRSKPRNPASHRLNSCYDDEAYEILLIMKTPGSKKRWIKPSIKDVMIFFECTCYAGSV